MDRGGRESEHLHFSCRSVRGCEGGHWSSWSRLEPRRWCWWKGRNYCGAWEGMRRHLLPQCLLEFMIRILTVGDFGRWLSRTEATRFRWNLRCCWMKRGGCWIEGGFGEIVRFQNQEATREAPDLYEGEGSVAQEEGAGVRTQMSTHCITLCRFISSQLSPPTSPFNVSFRHPLLCWGRSIQGRWQESALWRPEGGNQDHCLVTPSPPRAHDCNMTACFQTHCKKKSSTLFNNAFLLLGKIEIKYFKDF